MVRGFALRSGRRVPQPGARTAVAGDPLAVVEAAYRLDVGEEEWLACVMVTAWSMMNAGLGTIAFTVDETARVDLLLADGLPAPHLRDLVEPLVRRSGLSRSPCGTMSEALPPALHRELMDPLAAYGMKDAQFLNALDPSGHGCVIAAGLPSVRRLSPAIREPWTRVAVHLTAARRLRRRLQTGLGSPADVEAVLRPSGALEQVGGAAKSSAARAQLRRIARARERARGTFGLYQPTRALAEWTGLIAARWTLIDEFDSDGNRYLVARRNDAAPGGLEMLSERERLAVGYASLGHANKLIAYEMGLSASTVGVLLWRASRNLGVASRAELVEQARRSTRRSQP
jgi:DNA-binding CsgD family transcriptional regulator